MIAFYQDVEDTASAPQLRRARQLAASTLLPAESEPAERAPPVPGWKAWLFCAWVVVVAGFYFLCMVGVLCRQSL